MPNDELQPLDVGAVAKVLNDNIEAECEENSFHDGWVPPAVIRDTAVALVARFGIAKPDAPGMTVEELKSNLCRWFIRDGQAYDTMPPGKLADALAAHLHPLISPRAAGVDRDAIMGVLMKRLQHHIYNQVSLSTECNDTTDAILALLEGGAK